MFFTGHQAYRDRHEVILKGPFLGTKLQLQVVSLRFLTPGYAICETLTWVSDFKKGAPPDLHLDAKGRLRTRLLQVFAKRGGDWQIVVYHNLDIKPDVETRTKIDTRRHALVGTAPIERGNCLINASRRRILSVS